MTWRYSAAREFIEHPAGDKGEWRYTVREDFGKYGFTGPIEPDGETLDELIVTLERMLADVRAYPVIGDDGEEVTE